MILLWTEDLIADGFSAFRVIVGFLDQLSLQQSLQPYIEGDD